MAALANCLLLSASCAALVGAAQSLPSGFPCNATPTVVASFLPPFPASNPTAWPGACLDLNGPLSSINTKETCRAECIKDTTCSVWQLTPTNECWVSSEAYTATQCYGRDDDSTFVPIAAERLQHGFVNVTNALAPGTFFPGLKTLTFKNSSTDAVGIQRCKDQCYSILACEKWIYVTGTATDASAGKLKGCHLQTKGSSVGASAMLPAGQTSSGEEIVHTCVPPPAPPPVAKVKDNTFLWTILALIVILLLLVIAAIVIFFLCCQKEDKPKKTRAVKVAPKQQPQVLQPLVRMPVVQQPMVQYAAPTVTTAMVTPTYQAVPQAAPAVYASAPMVQSVAVAPTVIMR